MQSLQANHSVVTECWNEWLDAEEEDGSICLAQGWTIGKMFAKDAQQASASFDFLKIFLMTPLLLSIMHRLLCIAFSPCRIEIKFWEVN